MCVLISSVHEFRELNHFSVSFAYMVLRALGHVTPNYGPYAPAVHDSFPSFALRVWTH